MHTVRSKWHLVRFSRPLPWGGNRRSERPIASVETFCRAKRLPEGRHRRDAGRRPSAALLRLTAGATGLQTVHSAASADADVEYELQARAARAEIFKSKVLVNCKALNLFSDDFLIDGEPR